MPQNWRVKSSWAIAASQLFFLLLFHSLPRIAGQQLSIRHYDVSDGLAHSHVTSMLQDAKGYLWLGTWEGLSRFDGYHFTNYTQREGLGDPIINDIVEDHLGRLWVATNGGGIARLNDSTPGGPTFDRNRATFTSFRVSDLARANRVNALLFDSTNRVWCATDGGLFRAATDHDDRLNFEMIVPYEGETDMVALADREDRL